MPILSEMFQQCNGGSLVRQKKLHSTQTPFPCNICATVYLSKSRLDLHLLSRTSISLGVCSAQRVPEPDPLPGISFDTRPDLIQF